MFGSFPPSPLVGLRLQSLLGPGSRHCYGIISLIGERRAVQLPPPEPASACPPSSTPETSTPKVRLQSSFQLRQESLRARSRTSVQSILIQIRPVHWKHQ